MEKSSEVPVLLQSGAQCGRGKRDVAWCCLPCTWLNISHAARQYCPSLSIKCPCSCGESGICNDSN